MIIPADLLEAMGGGPTEVHPRITGPTPTSRYEYLTISPKIRTKAVLWYTECVLTSTGSAERIDLVNGSRIYRVAFHSLWRLPSDKKGPFITVPGMKIRFGVNDPTVGIATVNEWWPV